MRGNLIKGFLLFWLFSACNNTVGVSDLRQSDVTIDREAEDTPSKTLESSAQVGDEPVPPPHRPRASDCSLRGSRRLHSAQMGLN